MIQKLKPKKKIQKSDICSFAETAVDSELKLIVIPLASLMLVTSFLFITFP